ncbi:MAG: hypothetical protein JO269_10880 [Burkholderiaceae bacterium]|nr:hypothetical protein [Burkholderiaceae bacterium]
MSKIRPLLQLLIAILPCLSAAAVTLDEVNAGALRLYQARLAESEQRQELDGDQKFLRRVQGIAGKLIAQAEHERGAEAAIVWEIHTSGAPDESASCMAGGKLLIGQAYVEQLELNDAELAMLIAHEMEHALLQHNLKEMREALRLEPERLQRPFSELEYAVDHDNTLMNKLDAFNAAQELEADHDGFLLAWRAGWPAAGLANYYKKAAHADTMANFDRREHPASARRWQAIQTLSKQIGNQGSR